MAIEVRFLTHKRLPSLQIVGLSEAIPNTLRKVNNDGYRYAQPILLPRCGLFYRFAIRKAEGMQEQFSWLVVLTRE